MSGIEELRRATRWADGQPEDLWRPANGSEPTSEQIVCLFNICLNWGVDDPRDLSQGPPEARESWKAWNEAITR